MEWIVKLSELVKSVKNIQIKGPKEIPISGLSIDSRKTAPGNLFIAKKGLLDHGARFIGQALEAGASAVLTDLYDPFVSQTQIIHPDPGSLEPLLAAAFYKNPSKELWVCGTTGTKGKTTTSYLIYQLLNLLGTESGLIGGVETIVKEHKVLSSLTTHDAIFNQKWLREMALQKCKAASLEVSSHGILQGRVDAIDWDAAIFTNLSADHLDYHKTLDSYAAAKRELFSQLEKSPKKNKRAFFGADSPWGPFMKEALKKTPSWSFGFDPSSDIRASDLSFDAKGMQCQIHFQGESLVFRAPLVGAFNALNLLAVVAVGLHLGFSLKALQEVAPFLQGAPGRLQKVSDQIFVDHAHSGVSLAEALKALQGLKPKKLWVVFGAGGDRDPSRRKQMAEAAEKWADRVVVTTDNPRSEAPEEICRQTLLGFQDPKKVYVELDRKAAIFYAASHLTEGDLLLIAGKGHEKTQIFANKTIPFDDVEVAKAACGIGSMARL